MRSRAPDTSPEVVLFYRDFRRFTGGGLKVWDYFNHVLASPRHVPRISFSSGSLWDESNPWRGHERFIVAPEDRTSAEILFLGGKDWPSVPEAERDSSRRPIINLVQGVRHAWSRTPESAYLRHRAIRICVSEEVAAALRATRRVEGPLFVIPNALDRTTLPTPRPAVERDLDLLIVADKQPVFGRLMRARLWRPGQRLRLLTSAIPRADFLDLLCRARVTLFLPNRAEGFYLPALEGMALGTVVVCPDCVGNRSFCVPQHSCLRPAFDFRSIVAAVRAAQQLPDLAVAEMLRNARATASRHDSSSERRAFLNILQNVDQLW